MEIFTVKTGQFNPSYNLRYISLFLWHFIFWPLSVMGLCVVGGKIFLEFVKNAANVSEYNLQLQVMYTVT